VYPSQKNFDFSRQIFEKFRFFQNISQKNLIFPSKFRKNFHFQAISQKISILEAKVAHLQLLVGKLFYFSSKVTTFEHTCTSYKI